MQQLCSHLAWVSASRLKSAHPPPLAPPTKNQGCESSFSNGTKFSSSSKNSVELLEFSSLSSVPLYENFRKIGTKFSSSSKKWAELQELSSLN